MVHVLVAPHLALQAALLPGRVAHLNPVGLELALGLAVPAFEVAHAPVEPLARHRGAGLLRAQTLQLAAVAHHVAGVLQALVRGPPLVAELPRALLGGAHGLGVG